MILKSKNVSIASWIPIITHKRSIVLSNLSMIAHMFDTWH